MGAPEVEACLTYLAVDEHVAALATGRGKRYEPPRYEAARVVLGAKQRYLALPCAATAAAAAATASASPR